ncbi:hypothetical protein [Streptomyces sp. cmx-10-25]|uniref:hypothetical protein n=1 Tax=Streptomyces sp. cmx-10-25 TaxID=2790919 RepID=UPI00398159D8
MSHDPEDLGRVARVLNEALVLFQKEHERLKHQYREQANEGSGIAGGPRQTILGIERLVGTVRDRLDALALYAGYAAFGINDLASRARERSHDRYLSTAEGADRMARPLGEDTVRALQLLHTLGDFLGDDTISDIDRILAAPQATYPPTDWDAYHKEEKRKMKEKAGRL